MAHINIAIIKNVTYRFSIDIFTFVTCITYQLFLKYDIYIYIYMKYDTD